MALKEKIEQCVSSEIRIKLYIFEYNEMISENNCLKEK
jgi:hypothetical protein